MLQSRSTDIGTGTQIEKNIIEVYIHTGIELDKGKLLQGYAALAELAGGGKFALLVDRTRSDYSITFDALLESGNHPDLVAQALLVPAYNQHKKMIADTTVEFPRKSSTPIQVFTNRITALGWLRAQLDQALE
jgi:hypothetical protein